MNLRIIIMLMLALYDTKSFAQIERLYGILPVNSSGNVVYQGVDSIKNCSQETLYARSRAWVFESFKSGKDVLQLDDKEGATLTGNGSLLSYWDRNAISGITQVDVEFTFKIISKDQRYKYIIDNIHLKYSDNDQNKLSHACTVENFQIVNGKLYREKNAKRYFASLNFQFEALIDSLSKFMSKPLEVDSNEW